MKAQGYVVLTLKFQKQGRRWTALCEELGTATFGRSLPEADQRLKEAVLLHLNTLEEVGERERFFKENKIPVWFCWHLVGGSNLTPDPSPARIVVMNKRSLCRRGEFRWMS